MTQVCFMWRQVKWKASGSWLSGLRLALVWRHSVKLAQFKPRTAMWVGLASGTLLRWCGDVG